MGIFLVETVVLSLKNLQHELRLIIMHWSIIKTHCWNSCSSHSSLFGLFQKKNKFKLNINCLIDTSFNFASYVFINILVGISWKRFILTIWQYIFFKCQKKLKSKKIIGIYCFPYRLVVYNKISFDVHQMLDCHKILMLFDKRWNLHFSVIRFKKYKLDLMIVKIVN